MQTCLSSDKAARRIGGFPVELRRCDGQTIGRHGGFDGGHDGVPFGAV